MNTWPEAAVLRDFLLRVSRRLAWLAALRTAAIVLAAAAAIMIALALAGSSYSLLAGVFVAAAGGVAVLVQTVRTKRDVASAIEQRAPECRNVIITAAELVNGSTPASYVVERVCHEAVQLSQRLDPGVLFPGRRVTAAFGGAALLFAATTSLLAARPEALDRLAATVLNPAAPIGDVEVVITPPSYTSQPARTLRNPVRIDALAGSAIAVRVRGSAAAVDIETLNTRQPMTSGENSAFAATLVADADGFIAIEARDGVGGQTARRLIALQVTPDQPPRVRITAPGRDLFFADANRTINLTVEADDDLALATLTLHYTRVSGSGEQFTFTEGVLPLSVTRTDSKTWQASGTLPLAQLALAAGDMLVYRGVAADRRPGAVPNESDAYIIEITAPGSIPMEGFSADDEDKYALSQQMVIMKTERLIARAASMPPDSVAYEALSIAAEQRSVRAEFVFMMGGELAEEVLAETSMDDLNEVAHAEADDEVIAGRLANQGRVALLTAIRSMSRASTALNDAALQQALAEEKIALTNIQRAFSRTRYILRALTKRERLDLTRRLTGNLSEARSYTRAPGAPERDAVTVALRRVLSSAVALAAAPRSAGIEALARDVLRADPADQRLQPIATLFDDAASATRANDHARARLLLHRAATDLTARVRGGLNPVRAAGTLRDARIDGALRDAVSAQGKR